MKSALFILLGLSAAATSVQAQYNYPTSPVTRGDPQKQRGGELIEADALELQALDKLESAIGVLALEIQSNNNYDYGIRGTRGGATTVDLLTVALSMKNSSRALRDLTRGRQRRGEQRLINIEVQSLNTGAFNLINAIPSLARRSSNLIDNIYSVAKAVGAVELAVQATRVSGGYNGGGYNGGGYGQRPNFDGVRTAFCGLEFRSPNGTYFLMAGAGVTVSDAVANLHSNCNTIGGGTSSWTNAGACQAKVTDAKCVDAFELSAQQDPAFNRFTNCSLNFRSPNGTAFLTSGAGNSLVTALSNLYDSCNNIGGETSAWTNANACRNAVATKQFVCKSI